MDVLAASPGKGLPHAPDPGPKTYIGCFSTLTT